MFTRKLTQQDADNVQKALEFLSKIRNGIPIWEMAEQLGFTKELVEFYLDFVILKINPVIASRQLSTPSIIIPRDELKNYMKKGGFIADFEQSQEYQRQQDYDRALTRKELEVSIENSEKAIKASGRSNAIAFWALVVAIIALCYSIFGKKLFPDLF
ncbi:hypothetical protein [Niabella aurantiaca]|uniref:hypothetical protein n=1 Tax=Niabella aurantiaca TaxID=379900 RepID=UPI00036A3020|nr:hypothetical protein [Niabella aurantiaca]